MKKVKCKDCKKTFDKSSMTQDESTKELFCNTCSQGYDWEDGEE